MLVDDRLGSCGIVQHAVLYSPFYFLLLLPFLLLFFSLQSYEKKSTFPRKITNNLQFISSYLVKSGQKYSTPFPNVVPLHRERLNHLQTPSDFCPPSLTLPNCSAANRQLPVEGENTHRAESRDKRRSVGKHTQMRQKPITRE